MTAKQTGCHWKTTSVLFNRWSWVRRECEVMGWISNPSVCLQYFTSTCCFYWLKQKNIWFGLDTFWTCVSSNHHLPRCPADIRLTVRVTSAQIPSLCLDWHRDRKFLFTPLNEPKTSFSLRFNLLGSAVTVKFVCFLLIKCELNREDPKGF